MTEAESSVRAEILLNAISRNQNKLVNYMAVGFAVGFIAGVILAFAMFRL